MLNLLKSNLNLFVNINNLTLNCCVTGATVTCCQGSNPYPQASAICGHYFNIAPDNTNAAANNALCGQYIVIHYLWNLRKLQYNYTSLSINLASMTSFIADCVPPYTIDVVFDALNENSGNAANARSSCGKED